MKRLLIRLFPMTFCRFLRSKSYKKLQFVGEYERMIQRINKGVFTRERLKDLREDMRREFDKINEDLDATRLALKKNEDNKEICERLKKVEEDKLRDIEQIKGQIDKIDKQINEPGGVNETIDSYRAMLPLIERLIKKGE